MTPPMLPLLRGTILGVIALIFGVAIALAWRGGDRVPVEAGVLWPPAPGVPDFSLLDHTGTAFGRSRLLGSWHLVFFGYTHCPDVCPMTLGVMRELAARLERAPAAVPLGFLFVSVDPARDTPEVLRDYLAWFSPRFIGLTGPEANIAGLAQALGIAWVPPRQQPDGEYLVDHSAAVLLLDPEGRLVGLYQPPFSADVLETSLRSATRFLSQHIR
ncbi:MAG TPA: hypothetical protein DCY89_09525 [Gammaproteobacteria bacterium]|nr:hypothetical protein [Gammaproteobacteria bacterium]